jgi:peptidoglycan/xylan/chitin deacetylase (PgdA/CDA1 family)
LKTLLKKILVPLLASRPVSALASRLAGAGVPIFMLHRITPDNASGNGLTPAYLRRCLEYLIKHGYQFVSLEEVIAYLEGTAELSPKAVVFTMDDGYSDQAELAAPVFVEFSCPVTIFVVTGMLDGDLWPWFNQVEYLVINAPGDVIHLDLANGRQTYRLDSRAARYRTKRAMLEHLKSMHPAAISEAIENLVAATGLVIPARAPEQYRAITWDLARELERQGVKFGPQTISHPILSTLSDDESEREIRGSWERLGEELDAPCPVFCYPNGTPADFGEREIANVKSAGLRAAVSAMPGFIETRSPATNNPYSLPRVTLPAAFSDFRQYCGWIEYAKDSLRSSLA